LAVDVRVPGGPVVPQFGDHVGLLALEFLDVLGQGCSLCGEGLVRVSDLGGVLGEEVRTVGAEDAPGEEGVDGVQELVLADPQALLMDRADELGLIADDRPAWTRTAGRLGCHRSGLSRGTRFPPEVRKGEPLGRCPPRHEDISTFADVEAIVPTAHPSHPAPSASSRLQYHEQKAPVGLRVPVQTRRRWPETIRDTSSNGGLRRDREQRFRSDIPCCLPVMTGRRNHDGQSNGAPSECDCVPPGASIAVGDGTPGR